MTTIDIHALLLLSAAALAGLVTTAAAALRGWRGWLDLRRFEIERGAPAAAGGRIELADLRERVRKLEAIAAGVEL